MAQSLSKWAKETLTVRESGQSVVRVRLLANDSCWQTWFPDHWSGADFEAAIDNWCREVDETIAGLCDDWPARHVSVVLAAEDEAGSIVAQHVKSVRGRNKEANAKVFGGESQSAALAMDSLARTMERVLSSAATNTEQMAAANRNMMNHNELLLQQLQYQRLKELEQPQPPEPDPHVAEFQRQFFSQLPALIELGLGFLKERSGESGALGRAVATQAAKIATAGSQLNPIQQNGETVQ